MENHENHPIGCACCEEKKTTGSSRRDFLKLGSVLGMGLGLSPTVAGLVPREEGKVKDMVGGEVVQKGKAQHFTILHTADIHAQLYAHDEFFWEEGKAVYRKRGGMASLKTMLNTLRGENAANTLIIDGGDCFQGGGLASLTQGQAIVPMINNIGYDVMLPGNWEVVYGKKMMLKDLGAYNGVKICANMFHDTEDELKGDLIFQPYWIKMIAGVKIGFVGYNDPLTPKRQPPAYSKGIKFTQPDLNVKKYVRYLRDIEGCKMVFLVTHLGLAQQVGLANKPEIEGVDYILGADTHERIREPLMGKYAKVTEPGAFGSFVGKLDIVVENGEVKDQTYQLLEVDPERYPPDAEMVGLLAKIAEPHQAELKRVIGTSRTPLVRYFVLETPMDNLITDAIMWKFKPDIALSNGFRFCPPLVPDPKTGVAEITMEYLWSMLPVNSDAKSGEISGRQLKDWLEQELENAFAKNPAKRFGGWFVRFKGMEVNFTIGQEKGKRVNEVKVGGQLLDLGKSYSIVACERDGDPDDVLCRVEKVMKPKKLGVSLHSIMEEYLKIYSPVSPMLEGRAKATDAEATLLTQLVGYGYGFR